MTLEQSVIDITKKRISDLLDTADQEGCTPDLVVVSASSLQSLAQVIGHWWRNNLCENHLEDCDSYGFCDVCGHQ